MTFPLVVSSRAENDALTAILYYDLIHPKLGDRFISELSDTYEQIATNPEAYSFISSNKSDKFRDVKLKSFPYVVIYEFHKTKITVIAVLNTHRKPIIK